MNAILWETGSALLWETGSELLWAPDTPVQPRGIGSAYHGSAVRRQREQMLLDRTVSGRPGGVQWPRGG